MIKIKKLIPQKIKEMYRAYKNTRPIRERECPICNYSGCFTAHGRPLRVDAKCPSCGSVERHRLFWLWYERQNDKLREPIIHFAAESTLEKQFRELYIDYRTADLFHQADMVLDIENIDVSDNSVGTIICNHVLEHVNDSLALKELYRILMPGGLLLVSVPLVDGWDKTFESSAINTPDLRSAHFGQHDHIRYYGRDFRTRLSDAGFQLEEFTAFGEDVVNFSLSRGGKQFICRK